MNLWFIPLFPVALSHQSVKNHAPGHMTVIIQVSQAIQFWLRFWGILLLLFGILSWLVLLCGWLFCFFLIWGYFNQNVEKCTELFLKIHIQGLHLKANRLKTFNEYYFSRVKILAFFLISHNTLNAVFQRSSALLKQ